MTDANKKGALLFVAGLVLGGLVTSNHWSSAEGNTQSELGDTQAELAQSQSELNEAQQHITQLEASNRQAGEKAALLTEQLDTKAAEIVSLKAELDDKVRKYTEQAEQWKKQTEKQSVAIMQLKNRIKDADQLYAERHRLTEAINELNEKILKGAHKLELSQQACAEFKKGDSWNKVSQTDCDNFDELKSQNDAMIEQFDGLSAELDKVKRALSAFGNMPLPEQP